MPGTLTLTQNSTAVTGVGTAFLNSIAPEYGLLIDGSTYMVEAITSGTALTLTKPWPHASVTGKTFEIIATTNMSVEIYGEVAELVNTFGPMRDGTLRTTVYEGSASDPGVRFGQDLDTGLFHPSEDAIGVTTGGVTSAIVSSGKVEAYGIFRSLRTDGAKLELVNSGNNTWAVENVGGTLRFGSTSVAAQLTDTGILTTSGVIRGPNGTATAPTFTFTSDPNTGIFRNGEGQVAMSSNGTVVGTFSSAGLALTGDLTATGDITAPNFNGALVGNASTATKLATARTIAISGGLTGTATAFDGTANISVSTNVNSNHITNARLADMATQTFKGRLTAGAGDPEDLTLAQMRTVLGGSGSTFDADFLDGMNAETGSVADSIAARNATGQLQALNLIQTSADSENPTIAQVMVTAGVDGVVRKASLAHLKSQLALNNVENKSSATIRGELTSANVTGALTYTPVNKVGDTMTGLLTLSGDPTQAMHAATKQYVDNAIQGLDPKGSVGVATTANITLSGVQNIDGVTGAAGMRVLVKDQTTTSQNGIYLMATGAWTRTTDASTWAELVSSYVWVEAGTVYKDSGWVCTADSGGTLGTTAVDWVQFAGAGAYTAGSGLSLTGTQFSVAAGGVTNGMLANVATATFKGRTTAGTGAPEDLTTTQARSMLSISNVENKSSATIRGELTSANVTTALGFTPANKAGDTFSGNLTAAGLVSTGGVVARGNATEGGQIILGYTNNSTVSGEGNSTWNVDVSATNALRMFRVDAAGAVLVPLSIDATTGNISGTSFTGPLTGNVTGNADSATLAAAATKLTTARSVAVGGSGITAAGVNFDGTAGITLAASVDSNHITNARLADMATGTLKGRTAAGTGDPTDLTFAQVKTALSLDQVENKTSATIRSELTSQNVIDALGFTPAAGANGDTSISGRLIATKDVAGDWTNAQLQARSATTPAKQALLFFDESVDMGVIAARHEGVGNKTLALNPSGGDVTVNGSTVYHAGNLTKSTLGLSAVENKSSATIRGELTGTNVTNALTYVPVQQGTGTGQTTNTVKIGWSAAGRLKCTVDVTDQGNFVFDSHLTKAAVGLGSVDNTSDANKPISTATQTALNGKLNLGGGTMTGNLIINNGSPTVTFQDNGHMSAMLHCNDNLLYVLRGAVNSTTWTQVNGQWPLTINLSNNDMTMGGNATVINNLYVSAGGATGGGIVLADDGDIVDLNDGYCAMRFSNGVRIHSGNRTGGAVIRLGSDGEVEAPRLRATSTGDVSLASTGHGFQVGPDNGVNIAIDNNEIMARNNGAAATLALNVDGGNVTVNGQTVYHTGNVPGWQTADGRAYPRRVGGVDLNFNWSGQAGQPSWLWGGNDGSNMYVYNPSNFNVNYANGAGNSDTVDGIHGWQLAPKSAFLCAGVATVAGGVVTRRSDKNVSSIARVGLGRYQVNVASALPGFYVVIANGDESVLQMTAQAYNRGTGSFNLAFTHISDTPDPADPSTFDFIVIDAGQLA